MYDLLNICSGQGTCSVWTDTYRDYWQNEERVQGEGIETHFDYSAICPMLSNGIQVYFFRSVIYLVITFHNDICYITLFPFL